MNIYNAQDHDLILDQTDKKYVLRLRDLSDEQKPREKLSKYGPEVLSSAELLAIILNTGTKKEEIMTMINRIFKEYGEKNIVNQKNSKTLAEDLDIPLNKACQIVACFELGRRYFKSNKNGTIIIRTTKEVFEYLKDMRDLPKEHLRGLYLNSRYQLVHDEVISIGSLTANIIHPREVFRPAFTYSAVAVILAHNHPSGDAHPTQADVEITKQLVEAGKILGIDLLDHVVIARDKFKSININNK